MNSLWSSRGGTDSQAPQSSPASQAPRASPASGADAEKPPGSEGEGAKGRAMPPQESTNSNGARAAPGPVPPRPSLLRNQASQPPPAVPPPPSQPPPPPGQAPTPQQPPDSLSLAQLRRIVADFPRSEPLAYDFVYEDFGPVEEEIDEWFVYQYWQWVRLSAAQRAYEWQWEQDCGDVLAWDDVEPRRRDGFVREALEGLSASDSKDRLNAVGRILYIVLGRWCDTAGGSSAAQGRDPESKSAATDSQLEAMKAGARQLVDLGGLRNVWDALRLGFEPFWGDDPQQQPSSLQEAQDELVNLMTVVYIVIQLTLSYRSDMGRVHQALLELNPSLVDFMLYATSRLRWDETGLVPQSQVFLLLWKTILLAFGGTRELEETKKTTAETANDDKEKNVITASPLDYHTFRQELTSKYPAYVPPQAALPLEADHTSLLPPLPHQPARNNGSNGILPGPPNSQAGGASILHQPVHIATPAPSPPPSPGVGGKGGKKQNYQTNQNFPFMYPPLDATSNSAGGKGNAGRQDLLVGRKWEGSDVPASILEAGELFSRRVRMTRATRQLWEERERFIKYARGWDDEDDDDVIEDLDLSSLSLSEKEELGLLKAGDDDRHSRKTAPPEREVDYGPNPDALPAEVRQRLDSLEQFYGESLPHLQSLVIVLLKAILFNVTVLLSQPPPSGPQQQQHPGAGGANGPRAVNGASSGRGPEAANGSNGSAATDGASSSQEEVDNTRTREITTKAVSGVLLLLLKWLKLSHILKFEYLGQLLLDANYLPLVLKLLSQQDVQQTVDSKSDRVESRAGAPEKPEAIEEESSEDDAAPPPIRRQRSPLPPLGEMPASEPLAGMDTTHQSQQQQQQSQQEGGPPLRPEVDELGYPVNPLPKEPITDFSRRNFLALINLLRVMQKVCKNKAHRNLLMVQYKSSNILRKSLRVPQPELRLYTLKLFKNQVPYCGRKWRQGNMRVITAVYLHCRPELRDEWLAGSDIDAEVEEALPLEQALRSLTHWYNVRRYPGAAAAGSIRQQQQNQRDGNDFFVRELERADLHWTSSEFGDDAGSMSEWDGMPA